MPTAPAIVYLESELPQYTEGVTFELSLRRSSVGHRDIREEGVHWVWQQLFWKVRHTCTPPSQWDYSVDNNMIV